MKNSGDNVFEGILSARKRLPWSADTWPPTTSPPTVAGRSVKTCGSSPLGSLAANAEPFRIARVTTRDMTDFRDHASAAEGAGRQPRSTGPWSRCGGSSAGWWRRACPANPAKAVKELRRQQLAPKGMEREPSAAAAAGNRTAAGCSGRGDLLLILYTGCRVSDAVALELHDLMLGERSGSVVFRLGKGNKQRSVPLPLPARRALQAYLETRPPLAVQQGVHRRTRAADREGHPGVVRQVFGASPASGCIPTCSAHDGPRLLSFCCGRHVLWFCQFRHVLFYGMAEFGMSRWARHAV